MVALWLESWTLDQVNLGSNPLAAVLKIWQFRSPLIATENMVASAANFGHFSKVAWFYERLQLW